MNAPARRMPRQMTLTPELVALTLRPEPDLGPEPGWTEMSEAETEALAQKLDRECGAEALWVFAYGSLIWKPDFDAQDHRRASAWGWHRSFCLKMHRWRGSPRCTTSSSTFIATTRTTRPDCWSPER